MFMLVPAFGRRRRPPTSAARRLLRQVKRADVTKALSLFVGLFVRELRGCAGEKRASIAAQRARRRHFAIDNLAPLWPMASRRCCRGEAAEARYIQLRGRPVRPQTHRLCLYVAPRESISAAPSDLNRRILCGAIDAMISLECVALALWFGAVAFEL